MKARMKRMSVCLLAFTALLLTGCHTKKEQTEIYFLSWKPETAQVWRNIAQDYEKETGVKLKVLTSPNGAYERVLSAEIAKRDMPTFFQVSGRAECERMKDIFVDLKDTNLYEWLLEKDMAITRDGEVHGVPAVVEGYGIIYNQSIINKYFALSDRETQYQSMEQVNSLQALTEVVEDMTRRKSELGIDGVFASTSFKPGEDWRWHSHLMNMPFYYEFKDIGEYSPNEIQFSYAQNVKGLFDLYLNNSVAGVKYLNSITVEQSINEFATGSAAMIQNGNWAWNQIAAVSGNVVKEEDIRFLPLYIGTPGEEKQGICVGTENYFCVNSLATEEQQKASIEFLEWLYSSDTGKKYVTEVLGFISPYSTFGIDETPNNPLAKEVSRYMNMDGVDNVNWIFASFPGQKFREELASQLLEYSKGIVSWKDVVKHTKANWVKRKEREN